MKTLNDWLVKLEGQSIKRINLNLDNIKQVAENLDLTTLNSHVITVAGTNGKGSTVAILESIYHAAAYSTGSFTSPHLFNFNERIKINKTPVSDEKLLCAFNTIEKLRNNIELTYFEYTTLVALYIFKHTPLDVIILEVGLGGRLDATNIIDADIAIISSIGLDHQEYLGTNRESIGLEKAGIFRKGQHAIFGDKSLPVSIERFAKQCDTTLHKIGREFDYERNENMWDFDEFYSGLPITGLKLSNAACAIKATQLLTLPIDKNMLIKGLMSVQISARCQRLHLNVPHLIDVSHNPDSLRVLYDELLRNKPSGKIIAVFSMYQDKAIKTCVKIIDELIDIWHIASLDGDRGASIEQLLLAFEDREKVNTHDTISKAYQKAYNQCGQQDLIVIFGSFQTVATIFSARYNETFLEQWG
jgi:dihydrofolate synthase / folylpolyglutamate synthase